MNIHYDEHELKDCKASDVIDFLNMVHNRNYTHVWIKWYDEKQDPDNLKMTTVTIAFSAIRKGDTTSRTYYFENYRSKEPGCKSMKIIQHNPAHDCTKHLEYEAEIGAPGKGYAYRCQICDTPYWTLDKQTFYPYRDIDPSCLELTIADVI